MIDKRKLRSMIDEPKLQAKLLKIMGQCVMVGEAAKKANKDGVKAPAMPTLDLMELAKDVHSIVQGNK